MRNVIFVTGETEDSRDIFLRHIVDPGEKSAKEILQEIRGYLTGKRILPGNGVIDAAWAKSHTYIIDLDNPPYTGGTDRMERSGIKKPITFGQYQQEIERILKALGQ